MGGTSSPLTWNICFDPILSALAATVHAATPTYVDDLMCLVRGPRQALAAMIFLVAVSRCAGLHTEMHRCAWVEAEVELAWAAVAFAALPVETSDAGGGWTRLRGLPPAIMEFLLLGMDGGPPRDGIRFGEEECRCRVKTAVIPEEEVEAWRHALRDGPFGPGAVRHAYPCLGVTVSGRSIGRGPARGAWHAAALTEMQLGTWQRPGNKAVERAAEIRTHQASAGHRAVLWNTYVASLMLYPGQACEPPDALARSLRALCSQTFGARKWAPWWLLSGLGVQLAVNGAPKCLEATAVAAGVLAWLRKVDGGPRRPEASSSGHGTAW